LTSITELIKETQLPTKGIFDSIDEDSSSTSSGPDTNFQNLDKLKTSLMYIKDLPFDDEEKLSLCKRAMNLTPFDEGTDMFQLSKIAGDRDADLYLAVAINQGFIVSLEDMRLARKKHVLCWYTREQKKYKGNWTGEGEMYAMLPPFSSEDIACIRWDKQSRATIFGSQKTIARKDFSWVVKRLSLEFSVIKAVKPGSYYNLDTNSESRYEGVPFVVKSDLKLKDMSKVTVELTYKSNMLKFVTSQGMQINSLLIDLSNHLNESGLDLGLEDNLLNSWVQNVPLPARDAIKALQTDVDDKRDEFVAEVLHEIMKTNQVIEPKVVIKGKIEPVESSHHLLLQ